MTVTLSPASPAEASPGGVDKANARAWAEEEEEEEEENGGHKHG